MMTVMPGRPSSGVFSFFQTCRSQKRQREEKCAFQSLTYKGFEIGDIL
jgi:hypothetical protein